jgi:hypothetical protein
MVLSPFFFLCLICLIVGMRGTTFNYANREEDAPFAASTPSVVHVEKKTGKEKRKTAQKDSLGGGRDQRE